MFSLNKFPYFLLTVGILAQAAWGQMGTASLAGNVTDSSGAAIVGATVNLESTTQKYVRTSLSGAAGEFKITAIPPGDYRMVVAASGFQSFTQAGISLSSGQASTLDARLALAGSTQEVTVTAAPPLLQSENATLGTSVPTRHVTKLPILGQSFLNMLAVAPGVAPVAPAGATTDFSPVGQSTMPSVYGQRQKNNNFTMDGVENRDPNLLGVPIYPPAEAIAELKIESAMTSGVYGHASGATVNLVTKSGTSSWHGAAWEFFRNNAMDARNFFLPSVGAFRWNQFGGSLGGPLTIPKLLPKERAWYIFGYYEGVRIREATNFRAFVPTASELGGNFAGTPAIFNPFTTVTAANGSRSRQPFPGNQIPASMINPATRNIARALYPEPNLPAGQIPGVNYLNTSPAKRDGDQWNARADHQFGPRDSFFSRYTEARNPSAAVSLPLISSKTLARLTNLMASNTHTFSPTFLITGRFGMSRVNFQSGVEPIPGLVKDNGVLDVFPAFRGLEIIPPTTIAGYTSLGQESQVRGPLYQNSYTGDAQKIIGSHTLEFGGGVVTTSIITDNRSDGVAFTTAPTSNFIGNTGYGFATYLLGLPESATRNAGVTEGRFNGTAYSLYVQDTWRLAKKLTLNLGVRYDYAHPLKNEFGQATFVYETGQYVWDIKNPITGEAPNAPPGLIPPDRNNFAPRFGLAYQLNPKTVIRSGYGIFYDTFGSNYVQTQQAPRGNWPFAFPQTVTGLNSGVPNAIFPAVFPGPATGSRTPLGCRQCLNIDKNTSRTSYAQQWTFSLQRQLTPTLSLEAAYIGSHSLKLTAQIVDNTALTPGPGSITLRQKNPQFPPFINNGMNIYPSWYQGVSTKLQKRLSRGLSFMVSYTFSKTMNIVDNLSNASLGGQPTSNPTRFNLELNKAVAGFDIPHNWVTSFVYDVPVKVKNPWLGALVSGWNVSGVLSFYSGVPFSAFINSDVANIGTVAGRSTQYAHLVGNPKLDNRTPTQWFNTAAFAQPAQFTFGNAGRNILRTAGLQNLDLSLGKRFPFRDSKDFELRGEFFNLPNHANFGYPGVVVGTAQFGRVANTRNAARQIQLVLKFHF